jgi:hypothetical protein
MDGTDVEKKQVYQVMVKIVFSPPLKKRLPGSTPAGAFFLVEDRLS